jgi:hypothetical protein
METINEIIANISTIRAKIIALPIPSGLLAIILIPAAATLP